MIELTKIGEIQSGASRSGPSLGIQHRAHGDIFIQSREGLAEGGAEYIPAGRAAHACIARSCDDVSSAVFDHRDQHGLVARERDLAGGAQARTCATSHCQQHPCEGAEPPCPGRTQHVTKPQPQGSSDPIGAWPRPDSIRAGIRVSHGSRPRTTAGHPPLAPSISRPRCITLREWQPDVRGLPRSLPSPPDSPPARPIERRSTRGAPASERRVRSTFGPLRHDIPPRPVTPSPLPRKPAERSVRQPVWLGSFRSQTR